MCQGKQKYNEHVQTLAELHMIPHLYVSKPIHFLLYCNFYFDFQLPSLLTGIAKSRLATNQLPSFMTWKTAIASLDHKFPLSCLSLMSGGYLVPSRSPCTLPSWKILSSCFLCLQKLLLTSKCPPTPSCSEQWAKFRERDWNIKKGMEKIWWLTHVDSLCPLWTSTETDSATGTMMKEHIDCQRTQRPLKLNTDHSWCQLNSLQH